MVTVVPIRVITHRARGKSKLVLSHIFASWNVPGMLIISQIAKVIMMMSVHHMIQAMRLQSELTSISLKDSFFGSEAIRVC